MEPSKKQNIKLYHYTTAEKAIQKILPFFELRMGKIENMNDPLENLLHYTEPFSLASYSTNHSILSHFTPSFYLRNESKLLSFSINKTVDNKLIDGYAFPRMWAQYGGNNAGVCLEINLDSFLDENRAKIKEYAILHKDIKYDNFSYKLPPSQKFGVATGSEHKKYHAKNFGIKQKKTINL